MSLVSRTYQTCERIMEAVVKAGYIKQINWISLRRFIKQIAGGDKRTVEAYREHLMDFEFLTPYAPSTTAMMRDIRAKKPLVFDVNLLRLPYAQTRLDELVQAGKVMRQVE